MTRGNTTKKTTKKPSRSQKFIDLFNDYAKTRSGAMCKTKQGTGIKILTPKQMLQILPIALVQVKAGNKWNQINCLFSVSIKINY